MHRVMLSFVVLASLSCFVSSDAWPVPSVLLAESRPNIEVSLAPPVHPLSSVSADIGELETARETFESGMMDQLEQTARLSLATTKAKIDSVTASMWHSFKDPFLLKSMTLRSALSGKQAAEVPPVQKSEVVSFLGKSDTKASMFQVEVKTAPHSDASINKVISAVEQRRAGMEKELLTQAVAEVRELPSMIASELEAQISTQIRKTLGSMKTKFPGFLQTSEVARTWEMPQQANVRVVNSDIAYPTVESLVKDMEQRRDDAELLAREKVAMTKIILLQSANQAAKEALDRMVKQMAAHLGKIRP